MQLKTLQNITTALQTSSMRKRPLVICFIFRKKENLSGEAVIAWQQD